MTTGSRTAGVGAAVLAALQLEDLGGDRFRGHDIPPTPPGRRLYGGQVMAQALRAAAHTVQADQPPHSMHVYFLREGAGRTAVDFRVGRVRDGRSFSTREVRAVQGDTCILTATVSFHRRESGPSMGQRPAPAPSIEAMQDSPAPAERFASRLPVEVLACDVPIDRPIDSSTVQPASTRRFWIRLAERFADPDPATHASVLAYLSDYGSMQAMMLTVAERPDVAMFATLDHSVWFHRPVDADQWHLVDLRPVSVAGGRGLVTGSMHSTDGTLVASFAQEGLIRLVAGG